MLDVYTEGVSVAANSVIPLDNIKVWKGRTSARAGNSIALNTAGVYVVSVTGYATSTTAGVVEVQLYRDNAPDPSAISQSSVAANGTASVAIVTQVQVDHDVTPAPGSSPVVLQLMNGDLEATWTVNVAVERIA